MSTPALGPFLALYCREVLGDVDLALLDDDQFGRLIRYWLVCSEIGGRLPGDPAEIAKRSRIDVRKVRRDVLWFPKFFIWDEIGKTWRSERMEKQAAKYGKKVDIARQVGKQSTPQMGDDPGPHIDPYSGVDADPQMGGDGIPPNRSYTPVSYVYTQSKDTPVVPKGTEEEAGKVKPKGATRKGKVMEAVLGDYPAEMVAAMDGWRLLLKNVTTDEILGKFGPSERFIPTGIGTKEKTWNAWKPLVGKQTVTGPVTHADVLEGVRIWYREFLRRAVAGEKLAVPMLPTMLNRDDFVDAVVHAVSIRVTKGA